MSVEVNRAVRSGRGISFRERVVGAAVATLLALLVPGAAGLVAAQDEPATELRVGLGRLLGEHAFLTLDVVRTGAGTGPQSAAASDALDANTAEIVAAMEAVYGAEAADAFGELWRNHIGYLVDYARAVAAGDAEAAELAQAQLERYVADFSSLMVTAVPALPEEVVSGLIDEHVQQLAHVADLDESAYDDAYRSIRETYHHMFTIGDALAVGIVDRFPDRFAGRFVAFSPAVDVRITLERLFGEHTYLAALAMRASYGAAADAPSAIRALRENGIDLTAVIADVYGAPAGDTFGLLWDRHIDAYLAYVDGLASDDRDAAAAALDDLAAYRNELSTFVADANPHAGREQLEALIGEHNTHLVEQADAYAAGDYGSAFEVGRDAYRHSSQMAAVLAEAIADQFPQRFPDAAMPSPAGPQLGGRVASPAAVVALVAISMIGIASLRAAHGRDRIGHGRARSAPGPHRRRMR